jgi:UDP-glucuronate decarboxylase
VLVTGAGGFIGSHLVERLVKEGAQVSATDRFAVCGYENLQNAHNVATFDTDVCNISEVVPHTSFDHIFHLAAVASPTACEKNPEEAFRVNVRGTYEVLSFALQLETSFSILCVAVWQEPKISANR